MRFVCGCDYKDEQAMRIGEHSLLWTKEHTSEENKAWLRQLPQRLEFTAGALRFLLVHGSPRQLNEYLFVNTPEEVLSQFLTENQCDVLVCGHTHLKASQRDPEYLRWYNRQIKLVLHTWGMGYFSNPPWATSVQPAVNV
ncbi:hypothetical protein Dred_0587 [Desulforamulus reducens MI-1]|uniref:Calcineurin-like phosphoesterase domain-containing protein n=1 Tax=Desulforamulus reducens (strain ATCC BAA-1160 / DSM 100696 / MI-1) TaxID=349161 RepID=A4J226_DESRM|nr:metallophosphoesterase family protein [Desulforamulus reducens]ABO49129.1 hypothetical protein Dred_0587 [Desulforamulus reducens MI-1]